MHFITAVGIILFCLSIVSRPWILGLLQVASGDNVRNKHHLCSLCHPILDAQSTTITLCLSFLIRDRRGSGKASGTEVLHGSIDEALDHSQSALKILGEECHSFPYSMVSALRRLVSCGLGPCRVVDCNGAPEILSSDQNTTCTMALSREGLLVSDGRKKHHT